MTQQEHWLLRDWLVRFAYNQYLLFRDSDNNFYYLEPKAVEESYYNLLNSIMKEEGLFKIIRTSDYFCNKGC